MYSDAVCPGDYRFCSYIALRSRTEASACCWTDGQHSHVTGLNCLFLRCWEETLPNSSTRHRSAGRLTRGWPVSGGDRFLHDSIREQSPRWPLLALQLRGGFATRLQMSELNLQVSVGYLGTGAQAERPLWYPGRQRCILEF